MSPRRVYAHRPHSAEKHPASSSGKGLSKVPEALEGFHLVISELPSSASSAEHSSFIVTDNEDWVPGRVVMATRLFKDRDMSSAMSVLNTREIVRMKPGTPVV
ncbi:uncharacterized protein EV420DRAFT_1650662 [Desarmillaria tabescens]|uniref:Uncharacterized protein n=1 Tax=Armillaria tabescens TaxID=1929756 RepID=A0AA39JC24_ARMTA|nr:uncharacterized protein EV420DRAFT_1650662 [Desarmillaria tabescens]KAK0439987.1 hypothetical protein EV420DRAFT_1650662 [Desarmillaria tabescens]